VNDDFGYAVGNEGIILQTVNKGVTWNLLSSPTQLNLGGVYAVNSQVAFVVGESGTILKTSNGGKDWVIQASGTSSHLDGVYFADEKTGWAVGDVGVIRHTTDGGETWTAQLSGAAVPLTSVVFVNSKRGWAVGDEGVIVSTADGGESWKPQASGTANQLSGVSAINDSTAWIIGNGGTILKVTGKREVIVISVNETEVGKNDFENYPNPATTSSKIKFTIDESNIISLDLLTMTGHKALSLINQTRFNAGTYSMIIDVDELPSGMYYYVLTSGSRVITDKIIITR